MATTPTLRLLPSPTTTQLATHSHELLDSKVGINYETSSSSLPPSLPLSKDEHCIGIDLGTSYMCAAVMINNIVTIIPTPEVIHTSSVD